MPYNVGMSKLTVEGYGTFDVLDDKRLVLAIEQDAKVDVLHACGGNARCTTCRMEFIDGEPTKITAADKSRLEVSSSQVHHRFPDAGLGIVCFLLGR